MPVTINGSGSIAGLSVGGLPNGSVDADTLASNAVTTNKIANSAVTSAKTSGVGGLLMVEQWELSDEVIVSSAQTYMMTGTWAKRNQNGSGTIGASGMSVSSGVFTFPSTGVYHILLHCDCRNSFGTGRRRVQGIINTTHDNSTYIEAVKGGGNLSNRGSTTTVSNNTGLIFDVQNVSNYKVKFSINWSNEGRINARSTNSTATNVIFLKLGET